MYNVFTEANYPLQFRQTDCKTLGEHLQLRHSVQLVGMKRVGISSFLRFFLNQTGVINTYVSKTQHHLFIQVDLNDLIERTVFAFWRLLFKRLLDAIEADPQVSVSVKEATRRLFLSCIQSGDLFLTLDGIREALALLTKDDVLPTIFLIRFDRLKDVVSRDFYHNLLGLLEATGHALAYVFTSYRTLPELAPAIFEPASLAVFTQAMYLKPASLADMRIIYNTYRQRYSFKLTEHEVEQLLSFSGGHVQYLQLALIILHELQRTKSSYHFSLRTFISDERLLLQSEELYDNLTRTERTTLTKVYHHKPANSTLAPYLWNTGMVISRNNSSVLFSPLFATHLETIIRNKENLASSGALTKKEHLMLQMLTESVNEICERERLMTRVWPEYSEIGVSDWAIDRLVSRLRKKLKLSNSPFEIQTVRTRGFKLIEK